MSDTWTLATYNAGDDGVPPIATIVCIQERPSAALVERTLTFHDVFYPKHSALAIACDRERVDDAHTSLRIIHRGRAKVSPARFTQTLTCKVDGRKVAVINTHLVNNAFGPSVRGERKLRREWWATGWDAVARNSASLALRGYKVFKVGDFNRKARFWRGLKRVLGAGYDRIFYPLGVALVDSWHGDRAGSDHHPLIGKFRFTKETP